MKKDNHNKKTFYSLFSNVAYAMKKIWHLEKGYFFAFIPLIPLKVFTPLLLMYFSKILLDSLSNKVDTNTLLATIIVFSIGFILLNTFQVLCEGRIHASKYSHSFIHEFDRMNLFMNIDYAHIENPNFLHLRDKTGNVSWFAELIVPDTGDFLVNLLGIFTYGSIIITLNPLILILLIISTIINYLTLRYIRQYSEKNRDEWTSIDRKIDYLHTISSKFEYAKDIKIYNTPVWINSLLQNFFVERLKWDNKILNKKILGNLVDGILRFLRDGVAYTILIFMLLDNKINIGDFVLYFGTIAGFSTWITSIIVNYNDIVTKSIGIGMHREYLNTPNTVNQGKGIPLPTKDELPCSIEFKNLTFTYPESDNIILNNINFRVNAGEKLAIVGVNGAGKTTLVKLLCGLYIPEVGDVLINGQSSSAYNIEDYFSMFSVVFQDINLIPVTIGEFISGCNEIDYEHLDNALKLSGLYETVEKLPNGFNSHLIKGIFDDAIDLSGGEKQKLLLARALYKDAPIIIMDEPTAALDPIAENELYQKFNTLTKNKTSIYISHRLSSTRFCDRIIFLEDNKIAECGNHNELMDFNGKYAHMYNIQSHYYKNNLNDAEMEI